MPVCQPNKQEHLINLKARVRQLSPQSKRHLLSRRTTLLDPTVRSVALQQRETTCLDHRLHRRRRVRRVRRIPRVR